MTVGQTDHDLELRSQIFIAGVALFLVSFVVSLYRNHSLGWASIVATSALAIVVCAGLLLTSFIRLQPSEPADADGAAAGAGARPGQTAQPGQQAKRFDFSLNDAEPAEQAA